MGVALEDGGGGLPGDQALGLVVHGVAEVDVALGVLRRAQALAKKIGEREESITGSVLNFEFESRLSAHSVVVGLQHAALAHHGEQRVGVLYGREAALLGQEGDGRVLRRHLPRGDEPGPVEVGHAVLPRPHGVDLRNQVAAVLRAHKDVVAPAEGDGAGDGVLLVEAPDVE